MAEGYKDFTAGAVLAAGDLEDYCELQGIMRFASAAARTTALSGVLTEGLMCFLKDTNVIQVYTGSAWSTIGPVHGSPLSWTPVVTQGATPTLTVTSATYTRVGREITCRFLVTITSSGTAANDVTVSLPVTAAGLSVAHGTGFLVDASASLEYPFIARLVSGTTMKLRFPNVTTLGAYLGSTSFTAALANTDTIEATFSYVAASDA